LPPPYRLTASSPFACSRTSTPSGPVTLPKDIVWETDNDEPLIGSEKAIRGGTLNVAIGAYPLTFRIMGPNNNDFFASWNQAFTAGFGLVGRHPVTDKFIPIMATHWSIQKDQKTIYFKLDPDAKFSDGHPITADDYVFTWKMMQSKFIVDPFYNSYAERYYQSVDKIDDHTLRIVGTRPSWRPLVDYGGLWPTPAHATVLDKDWVTRTTNQPQIATWNLARFAETLLPLIDEDQQKAIEQARRVAKPTVILSGGETTVTVRGKGRGGRNVEYLLGEAIAVNGARGIWGLAADTDGVDGAEDIAGGLFSPESLLRARAMGRDPKAMLDDNDGHSFFAMLGDSIVTGPTKTNVNDFRATLIAP